MKTNYLKKITVLVLSATVFVSCMNPDIENYNSSEIDEVANESMNNEISDAIVSSTDDLIDNFINPQSKVSGLRKVVAIPTVERLTEEGVYPAEYVIDFGDWGYTDAQGRVYHGKVYKTIQDKQKSQVFYYSEEFYLNKNQINFKKVVTNDIKERKYMTIELWENVKYSNGEVSEKNWNRTRTLVDTGKDEKDWTDNTYEYTGSASGYTRKGVKFNFEIIKPLVSQAGYRYFVSGVTYTKTEKYKRTLDFGSGEQDNIAIETINDRERKIELKW